MATKNRPLTLYTQTASADVASVVSLIAGKHAEFATDFIGTFDANGAVAIAVALHAWRHAESGTWAIDRLTYVPSLGTVVKSTEAQPGLCFFDALDYCARFQYGDLAAGDRHIIAIPDELRTDVIHFTKAAVAAGQVIDPEGRLHPCVGGRILTNGTFSAEAIRTARLTKDMVMAVPAPAAPPMTHVLFSMLKAEGRPDAGDTAGKQPLAMQYKEKHRLIAHFKAALEAGDRMVDALSGIVENDFRTVFARIPKTEYARSKKKEAYLGAIVTLGLEPAISYLCGHEKYAVNRRFLMKKRDFTAKTAILPECDEKKLMLDFAAAAESALWLERAALVQKQFLEKSRAVKDVTEKGLRMVEIAGAAGNLSPVDIGRLQEEYLNGTFRRGQFRDSIQNAWPTSFSHHKETLRGIVANKIRQLENARLG